jgi:hypothetical protein
MTPNLVRRRLFWWAFLPALATLAILAITSAVLLRPAHIKAMIVAGLTRHLNLDTSLDEVSLSLLPRPTITATRLVLRLPNRPDLPPFISIERLSVGADLFSVIRKHVNTVHADGLRISVPPSDDRGGLPGGSESGELDAIDTSTDIIVDHLVTHDAELTFVPRKATDTPLMFHLYELTVDEVGFGRTMPFTTRLMNPVPQGIVQARGTVGPWRKDNGSLTPMKGEYTFTDADLSTINGIGGTLDSQGTFAGQLTAIHVNGAANVPNFSLDLGGKPVPLSARFQTIVDGSNGTTTLSRVDAQIRKTSLIVTGAISNLPGPGNHDVSLQVEIPNGRVEDVLAMVLDAPKPVMTGDVTLQTKLQLPPGSSRVRQRIRLTGRFGLARTNFTNADVQAKLQNLSKRSQGKDQNVDIGRVLTDLKGQFALVRGEVTLHNLTFAVPGATVHLDGTYGVGNGALDLHGSLAMQATVSQAVGGFKSIFLKPFDALFKRNGSGAVLPIKITGTREDPKFGLEMGKIFKRH